MMSSSSSKKKSAMPIQAQAYGLRSLTRKKKEGKVVVFTTDKKWKLTTSSRENYRQQGLVHVQKSRPISWKEVDKIKKYVKAHNQAIMNIFRQGEDLGEREVTQIRNTMME